MIVKPRKIQGRVNGNALPPKAGSSSIAREIQAKRLESAAREVGAEYLKSGTLSLASERKRLLLEAQRLRIQKTRV